jgi:hypothetical protein
VYDNLHLRFELAPPYAAAEEALAQAPAFAAYGGEPDELGRVRTHFRGLRIEYWPGQHWGQVRGSLHTFAHGPNSNGGLFAAADVARACTELAEALSLPPSALVVRKLEAGVNLEVSTSPRRFLEHLHHHKNSPFLPTPPPPGVARPLEYAAYHASYRLKFYDKGTYLARQGYPLAKGRYLLRFEMVFTRARNLLQLTGRPRLTLADLPAPDVMTTLATHLHKHWHLSTRHLEMNCTDLSCADMTLFFAGQNLRYWEAARVSTPPATFRRYKARYRKLHQDAAQLEGPHPYDLLLPKHLEALLPQEQPHMALLKSDTLCHTCNQLEVEVNDGARRDRIMLIEVPLLLAA